MLEDKLKDATERQLMYGEGTRYNFPQPKPKKPSRWKKVLGYGLITAGMLGAAYSLRAHDEPDFSKLPDVKQVRRMAIAYDNDVEVERRPLVTGTAYKVGEYNDRSYYATAYHLKRQPLPSARNPVTNQSLVVKDEFLLNGVPMLIEGIDEVNDTMIFSVAGKTSDKTIPQCKNPPKVGDQTYVYGYHRGVLGLSEGRIGNLEIEVLGYKDYYVDADVLGGASGAPHLKYEDDNFCVFGMVLANMDGGYFSVTRDISLTNKLYDSVLVEAMKNNKNNFR